MAGVYYFNARNAPSALTNAAIDTYTDKGRVVSKAVFGQVTYDFGDFQIVGGLRYNIDRAYQNGGYLTIRAIGLTSPNAPTNNTSRP